MADKNKKTKTLENVALEGAASEVVQRYGSAVKEHFVAYSGKDNETGEQLKRGLKDIAKAKVNSDYKEYNDDQKKTVAASLAWAGTIKAILDTPILAEDGSLTGDSFTLCNDINKKLEL